MVIVALGVTGDLMRLKILPALFDLYVAGGLPQPLKIVGLSRRNWSTADLQKYIGDVLSPNAAPQQLAAFLALFTLVQGEANDPKSFAAIKTQVGGERDILFYLSIAPELYAPAVKNISEAGFNTSEAKIIIEKPFGSNLESAEALEAALHGVLNETQIYRIDHYLAKDAVQDIERMRTSPEFATVWNKENISAINIRMLETVGAESRGALYDTVGALRDVGQNHLLEMFAVVVGGPRAQVLGGLVPLSADQIGAQTTRAQYAGYKEIAGVEPQSQTETYFKLQFSWGGVSVTLESGKRLSQNRKEIEIAFKDHVPLIINLEAGQGGEYKKLISTAIKGEHDLFVSSDEVQALWRFIDPIIAAWHSGTPPLGVYTPGA